MGKGLEERRNTKMSDVLASVTYDCTTPKGCPFRLKAEFVDGWGFQYGNHHGIHITEDSGYEYGLDARYDNRFNTVDGFYENILDVLEDRYTIAEARLVDKQ